LTVGGVVRETRRMIRAMAPRRWPGGRVFAGLRENHPRRGAQAAMAMACIEEHERLPVPADEALARARAGRGE